MRSVNAEGKETEMSEKWVSRMWVAVLCGILAAGSLMAQTEPAPAASPDPYANETTEQRDARMAWFRDAKFGMFIHWGVYAVPAGTYDGKRISGIGEWIMNRGKIPVAEYKAFAPDFTASKYDPKAWVALAKRAGMRYIVITSKHHDGFALFDSKVTDWDAVDASGAGRDLIDPLAKASRKAGLKFGLYYSQAQDWTHPGGAKARYKEGESWDEANKGDFDTYLRTIAAPQVEEILTRYKPDVLWWDTPTWMTTERAARLIPYVGRVPGIIHNNRLGGGFKGDTTTPEQHIPATGLPGDWEVCMTMNKTWGYKSYDHNWKSVEDITHKLCDIVSKGGNFLLNVGPTAEGEIPQESIDRLEAVGRWLDVNGEAIYGTTASPFHKLPWGRATKKVRENGATIYLHVFDWPGDGKLLVPGLRNDIRSASLLAGGKPIVTVQGDEGVTLQLPKSAPDAIASIIRLEVEGKLNVESVTLKQKADGSVLLDAAHVEINNPGYGDHAKIEHKGGKSNIGYWLDKRSWVKWTFVVKQPGTFTVSTEVASAADSALQWGLAGKLERESIASTGSYESFSTVTLGQVTIDKAGTCEFVVKPVQKKWSPVNLRAVALTPVQ
ncbi:MAG: glycosyl hydrolase [Verrucomicrobia bacterium]|nr:glycosyl hydrolase [Verrucomicrobiota bacterium]